MAGPFTKIGNFVKDTASTIKNMASDTAASMTGLAKDPIKEIKEILVKIPQEIDRLTSALGHVRKDVALISATYIDKKSTDELKSMVTKLDQHIATIDKEYTALSSNKTVDTLEVANQFCSSPVIMLVLSMPADAGVPVSALCGSLAGTSARIETTLANAEPVLDMALRTKEQMYDRIKQLKKDPRAAA
jgi:prefoldin subunit 5